MLEQSVSKRIAKNTIFLYIRMILVMVVSLYTSRVILNTLGASDYGIYNVVGGVVTIMTFLSGALGASTSRFLTYDLGLGDQEKLNRTFSAALLLHIGVALIVVFFGETGGLWLLYNKLVIPRERMTAAFWVLQASIITTCINFIQVPFTASIISHEKMSIYAYVGLYDAAAKLAIAYLITISPYDKLIVYAFLLMVNSLIVTLFYRFYTRRIFIECRLHKVKDYSLFKRLLSYTGWELFGGIASVSQGQGISIVLNMFFGTIVNAARGITQQISAAVTQFVTNFLLASRPQVIKYCAEGKYEDMYNLTFRTAKYSYLLMLAMVIPICFEIDFILKIWLGEAVPNYTNVFSIIVLITGLVSSIHTAALMPYHAIGKLGTGNVIGGTLMFISLPLTYFLFKMGLPPYWAFIAILITNSLQQVTTWLVIHSYVYFSYWDLLRKTYIPIAVVTVLALPVPFLIWISMPEGWLRLFVLVLCSEIVLVLQVFFIAMTKGERSKVINYARNIIYGKIMYKKR